MSSDGSLSAWLVAAGLLTSAQAGRAQEAPSVEWYGYAQLTAEHVDDDTEFDADRVRAGVRVSADRVSGGLQLDFNAGDLDQRPVGTLPNVIKDLFVEYRAGDYASVRLGQFKTPIGMDFLLSGHSLDITKRGMEKALVLERDIGLMVSGRRLPLGFGYDIGVFNPAGRSGATAHVGEGPGDQVGEDHAWAARIHLDPSDVWHLEAAVGGSQSAGGPGTEDYDVFDVGLRWKRGPVTLKGEYIEGRQVRGVRGHDERVWYAHAGYAIGADTELVVRHYAGRSETATGTTDLGNTYLGVNHHLLRQPGVVARVQLNVVFASGDEDSWTGLSGFRDDAVLLQVQLGYLP